ncbi:hypothetical protein FB451DRAFT_201298 [Mycena latifolia]|nr:hypothetical protein FB451DRAFT_201298 [Mycena latifolia]
MPSPFDTTLGAIEIGVLISYALFGFTTLQTYIYFSRFPDDRRLLKYMVSFVWFCELAHVICVGAALYTMTITFFGQVERLVRTPDSLSTGIIFSGFVGPCVQSFFAFRIHRLSNNSWYIPCFCWVLSFLRIVGATVVSVAGIKMVTLAGFDTQWGWLMTTVWAVGAANDLIIAGMLTYLISRQRYEGLPDRTLKVVDKLIAWTIETGAVTSIAGVITLISFVANKDNYSWLAWYVVTTRLYSNALLASLNSRVALRAMSRSLVMDGGIGTSAPSRTIAFGRPTVMTSGDVEISKVSAA